MITFSQVVLSNFAQIKSLNVLHHTLREKKTNKTRFQKFSKPHTSKNLKNTYTASIIGKTLIYDFKKTKIQHSINKNTLFVSKYKHMREK